MAEPKNQNVKKDETKDPADDQRVPGTYPEGVTPNTGDESDQGENR